MKENRPIVLGGEGSHLQSHGESRLCRRLISLSLPGSFQEHDVSESVSPEQVLGKQFFPPLTLLGVCSRREIFSSNEISRTKNMSLVCHKIEIAFRYLSHHQKTFFFLF